MENLEVRINNAERYDEVLKDTLPEYGDLEIITKDAAMKSGRAAVMFTFTVDLPDGSVKRVQAVTPLRVFRAIANAIAESTTTKGSDRT